MTESEEAFFRSILDDLTDLFGWEDKTPLHAALHVRNAILNLRADLAVARAVERAKIVAWLRTAPCNAPGHDPRWCQDCQVRECAADAIEDGVHRKPGDEVEAIRALRALLVAPRG